MSAPSFILDQGLPRSASRLLQEAGIAAVHVADLSMSRAPDEHILDLAGQRGAVVVTLDSDFSALLAARRASEPSVIHLRMQHLDVRRCGALLVALIPQVSEALGLGAVVSVSSKGYRIRRLPF